MSRFLTYVLLIVWLVVMFVYLAKKLYELTNP